MKHIRLFYSIILIAIVVPHTSCNLLRRTTENRDSQRIATVILPHQEKNQIKTSWPSIGCWFWGAEEFQPNGYRKFLDLHASHSPFALLTTSLRFPGELTDPGVHDQLKRGTEYARSKGLGIVMDLDLRLAREQFRQRYPSELQQIILLRELPLHTGSMLNFGLKSPSYGDHYTYGRSGYDALSTELAGCYIYSKKDGMINPLTVRDIRNKVTVKSWPDSINISLGPESTDEGLFACLLVAVTIFTPDVFAPHLLSYQRDILQQYRDVPFAGACKDEWGFPGRFDPAVDELWYSPAMAEAYAKRRPGHNLLRDMMLMSMGENGREAERIAAVNHYMEMNWQRNAEIETDYYNAIKETFGKEAVSATHPTWFPFPNEKEIFKNGLSWWSSRRDLAQTDETTPFAVRTALAKKMNSPLWYNMFYDSNPDEYRKALWSSVLAGGRINYHPLWPSDFTQLSTSLMHDSLLIAESRVSILNYISTSPVESPVAVIFGHPAAINFINHKEFADVGLRLTDSLWKEGFYADLIPSSEIENGSLILNADGRIQYGPQLYETVIFYHPEYARQQVNMFFRQAAANTNNKIYVVGHQSVDFDGKPIESGNSLPGSLVSADDADSITRLVIQDLKSRSILPQSRGEMRSGSGFPASVMPVESGVARLIDGTIIIASGAQNVMGDHIDTTININGTNVYIDAVGLAAIRMNKNGLVDAFAAGGLKTLRTGTINITLEEPADFAIIRTGKRYRGILHGSNGSIPGALRKITRDWTIIRQPLMLSTK